MATAPTASSHHCWVTITSARPASAAIAKKLRLTASTCRGFAAPDPVSRAGPTRCSSVPRTPSE